jgi:hypothetical protein
MITGVSRKVGEAMTMLEVVLMMTHKGRVVGVDVVGEATIGKRKVAEQRC